MLIWLRILARRIGIWKAIVASGLYLPYIAEEINGSIAAPQKDDRRAPCPDVYHDPAKIAFRDALLAAMAKEHLDAVVYPTWSNAPRLVGDVTSPAGDNSQVLSPQTGFPAITVPMGFTHGGLPAGLTILAPAFREDLLAIRYAYDFEQTVRGAEGAVGVVSGGVLEQNQDNRALNNCVQGADFLRKSALKRFALEYTYPDFALASWRAARLAG